MIGLRTVLSGAAALVLGALVTASGGARADETCQSPFLAKVTGQEDYVYVWTLGIEGMGDGSDKLVTVGANPARSDYGKVVASAPVGGRHEAHHGGFTDDRRHLWVGGLAEDALKDSSLGELLAVGMLDQFFRLRAGDRFFS